MFGPPLHQHQVERLGQMPRKVRRGEQAVDQPLALVGGRIGKKRARFVRRGRHADQIERHAAQEFGVGAALWLEARPRPSSCWSMRERSDSPSPRAPTAAAQATISITRQANAADAFMRHHPELGGKTSALWETVDVTASRGPVGFGHARC